jgi:hypothetical protein
MSETTAAALAELDRLAAKIDAWHLRLLELEAERARLHIEGRALYSQNYAALRAVDEARILSMTREEQLRFWRRACRFYCVQRGEQAGAIGAVLAQIAHLFESQRALARLVRSTFEAAGGVLPKDDPLSDRAAAARARKCCARLGLGWLIGRRDLPPEAAARYADMEAEAQRPYETRLHSEE